MTCAICRRGELSHGATTLTLERGATVLVLRDVPAQVCQACGEAYVSADTTDHALGLLTTAAGAGVQAEVRQYQPA